jgi:hypothetical protein
VVSAAAPLLPVPLLPDGATVVDEDVPPDATGCEVAGGAVVPGAAVVVVTAVTTMVPVMRVGCTRQW